MSCFDVHGPQRRTRRSTSLKEGIWTQGGVKKNGQTCENGSTQIKKYFVVAKAIIVQREIVDVVIIRTTTTNNINFDNMIATHSGQSIGDSHNSGQYIRRPSAIRRKRADSSLHLSYDWNENELLTDVHR
jgi:hypothetical protein